MSNHPLKKLIEKHKKGQTVGIYSVCSANSFVLKAALDYAKHNNSLLLVEATSNQVDQFGGYTGMTPYNFRQMVLKLAQETNYDPIGLLIGGDHLGPNRWANRPSDEALVNASEQIAAYVNAGFSKIHLDATIPLANDKTDDGRLPISVIAERTARLCAVAEETFRKNPALQYSPLYIIGSDVPVPGGARAVLEGVHVTPVSEVEETISAIQQAFEKFGLQEAWQRVKAIVVQPGVEFDHQTVFDYQPTRTLQLKQFIEQQPQFVYEAHSTDYQTNPALRHLVEDHFAILKVGPALTFAMREAVFALAFIEREILALHKGLVASQILETIEQVMIQQPQHWRAHYTGNHAEQSFARRFSFSDRIRYYWPQQNIQEALQRLLKNLKQTGIPLTLLSQFLPEEYRDVRLKQLKNEPQAIILHKIQNRLKDYSVATRMENSLSWNKTNHNQPIVERL